MYVMHPAAGRACMVTQCFREIWHMQGNRYNVHINISSFVELFESILQRRVTYRPAGASYRRNFLCEWMHEVACWACLRSWRGLQSGMSHTCPQDCATATACYTVRVRGASYKSTKRTYVLVAVLLAVAEARAHHTSYKTNCFSAATLRPAGHNRFGSPVKMRSFAL